MSVPILWKLPVPSTALLRGGPSLEDRPGREFSVRFERESENDSECVTTLVFEGVEAFRVTYLFALEDSMLEAYDELIDRGKTDWLESTRSAVVRHGEKADDVKHLMILFDDGPCYEALCRSFRIEESAIVTAHPK